MRVNKSIFCIGLILLSIQSVSQELRSIEEINYDLSKSKEDKETVALLLELSKSARYEGNNELYDQTVNKAFSMVDKVFDDRKLKSEIFIEKAWQLKSLARFDSSINILESVSLLVETGTQLESDIFHAKASVFYNISEYDSAVEYNLKALRIREALKDLEGQALSQNNVSLAYDRLNNYDKSIESALKSLKIREQLGHKSQMADVYSNLGGTYSVKGDYEKSVEMLLSGISILEEIKAPPARFSASWANLGVTYVRLKNYKRAIKAFNHVLAIQKEVNNKYHIAFAIEGLAVVFEEQQQFDSALFYQQKGLSIAKELQDKHSIARRLMGIGVAYEKLDELEKSEHYYSKSLTIRKEINDVKGIANNYINLGHLYLKSQKFESSRMSFNQAIEYARDNIIELSEANEGLYLVYKEIGQFEKSLIHYESFKSLSDSLLNTEKQKNISELEVKYEAEKKEREILLLSQEKELQQAEIDRNNLLLIGAVLLILLILIIGIILYNQRDLKAKTNLQKERTKLKSEQIQAVIFSQEKERRRFAMDLHDDFGQLISALKLNVSKFTGEEVSKSEEILDSMYHSLKNIAFDLMPHTLFEKGLEEAIEGLKDQIDASGSIQVNFQSFEIRDKINDDQKVAVYRIVQELISNTIKYADATKINISITDIGDGFSLIIEDNGNGYDVKDFKNGDGNGWKNIHSRLDLLDGEIDFDTLKGRKNTTIAIEIPYKIGKESAAIA